MTAEANVTTITRVSDLGQLIEFIAKFSTTATPTRVVHMYAVQETADTDQALDVGDVSTIELVVLKCISNDVDIDTSWDTTFSAEIEIQEGEVAVFKPTGVVYFQNSTAEEQSTIEYLVLGQG